MEKDILLIFYNVLCILLCFCNNDTNRNRFYKILIMFILL